MPKAPKDINLLSDKSKTAVRKAFRAGQHTVELEGKKFNIERGKGRGSKPFILVFPVNGMLPMGQIEVTNGSSTKLEQVKEVLSKATKRR